MDQSAFAYAISRTQAFDQAKTPRALADEIARSTRYFGLDHFIIAGVPAPFKKIDPYVLAHNWPRGWFDRYTIENYVHCDPVIRKLRSTVRPVIWTDAPYDPSLEKSAHSVMMEAREFKLNNGLSVPIYTQSGDQAAVSFGGARLDLSEEAKGALHLIAIYAHNRAFNLQHPKYDPPKLRAPLTKREIEILKWVAAGYKSYEIADKLAIGYQTVETHVKNACYKLDSVSRTQAVAEAIRAKLIP
jgi:LuxR family quorum sensing-dependent transcriptional regulator